MANSNFPLDFHVCKEGSFVVDFEREDAVLIRSFEGGAEDGAVGCLRDGLELEAMERREHAEFELEGVRGQDSKRGQFVIKIFRKLNIEGL